MTISKLKENILTFILISGLYLANAAKTVGIFL